MRNEEHVKDREYLRLTPKDIGEGVMFFRKQAGWKQFALAAEAGVNERTVQRIERGEKVSDESLRRVAKAFHLDDDVFLNLNPIPLPTTEEWEKAKREWAELTRIEARGLATLNDCAVVLTTQVLCFVNHAVSERLAGLLAEFKDLLSDWGDLWGDLSHVNRLEASRSVLGVSEKIGKEGYKTLYGVYSTEDRWKFRVAVLVFVPASNGRTAKVTQLVVPRTLQGLEKRGPVAMMSLDRGERVAPPTTDK